ncbi:pentapeptide repeat-containing protein [Arsenophonus nasoniae]|uniref:E3 ubiquitin-protein ligase SopA n=1 Tax=Arsenophonus nasoniae TaxID=638 RepID=A0AA95GSZ6_9GAMM|nr:pentapeptide repeat-containing protein [Arsenophonus nasoniae]WGM02389.1 pentapeptide repeat-containing protein [Arsenophonus nasoniae]
MFNIFKNENILFSPIEPDPISEEQAKVKKDMAILTEKLTLDSGLADRQDLQNKKLAILMEKLQTREAGDCVEINEIDLTGMELPAAIELCNVNLMHSKLVAVKMMNANLQDSNLSSADLSKIDLSDAKLNNATLIQAVLTDANIANADLQNANFRSANLKYCNLAMTNLSGAHLQDADLMRAKLMGANLSQAILLCSVMQRADLTAANMSNAEMYNIDLTDANLTGANLEHASGESAILTNAKMIGVNLTRAYFRNANMQNVDLTNAILLNSHLFGADLTNANLTDANLKHANLTNVNLTNSDLSGATISLQSVINLDLQSIILHKAINLSIELKWEQNSLDLYLNHINNRETNSVLTQIASIDKMYDAAKIDMIKQIIASLSNQRVDISSVSASLIDILAEPPYYADAEISNWLKGVCANFIEKFNDWPMPLQKESVINLMIDTFQLYPDLLFSCNSAFIQTISQAIYEIDSAELKQKATTIYDHYLKSSQIQPYVQMDDFGSYSNNKVDWSDKNAANYILFSSNEQSYAMMLSQNVLAGMLMPNLTGKDQVLNQFFLYQQQNNLNQTDYQLEDIFKNKFPIFYSGYQSLLRINTFNRLLDLLDLDEKLYDILIAATKKSISTEKLVNPEEQIQLEKLLTNKAYQFIAPNDYQLTEKFYQDILNIYKLKEVTDKEKAEKIFSLSAVFVKYTSSAILGTETESPNALRYFSCAMLNKAYELCPTIFDSEQQVTEWKNRLLGLEKSFSCTAVLSSAMIDHARKQFSNELATVLPPDWY